VNPPTTSVKAPASAKTTASRAKPLPTSVKVVSVLLDLTGVMTVVYWVLYFATGVVQAETSEVYIAFENSFPLADAWMAAACFAGAAGLFLRRHWGLLFGICAGATMIFLGCMDVLFNLEQGMYAVMNGEMVFETLINVWTLGFGAFVLWFLWSRRKLLLD
jgi:hypothetical protein